MNLGSKVSHELTQLALLNWVVILERPKAKLVA